MILREELVCVASTTWSNRSVPPSVTMSMPSSNRRTERTAVARRMSWSVAASFFTYSRDPPFTVRHWGRFVTASRPWLRQKCRKVESGKRLIWVAGVDQMQAVAEVFEADVRRVRVGQRALVRSPALPQDLTGTVTRIRPKVQKIDQIGDDPVARKDARIVEVEIKLDDGRAVANLTNLQVEVEIGR